MQARKYYAATVFVYLATLAYILLRWDSIPDPIPVHFDIAGNPDQYTPKTFFGATALLWIGAVISTAVACCVPPRAMVRRTTDVPSTSPIPFSEANAARVELLTDKTATFVSQTIFGMAVCMCLSALSSAHLTPFNWLLPAVWIVFTIGVVVLAIALTLNTGKQVLALPTDEDEQIRNEHFRYAGGMGVYSESQDPAPIAVFPSNPGKLQINTAHEQGRRYLWRAGIAITASAVACIVFAAVM
ncbi:DUF1648 domain-containing protein [Corynebacterium godavarianum]|uniref:DUF1648 domain-containing protein n=1 Tax=Corynebacterium godavarianum TaxID=2054421 RepID=A0ABY3E8H3_9CORY|nr:DUF1648 domain-containing protein [Corynebacterium godavarianum]MBL7286158.1 DUF1648 domain-containing protein [Corynebacterium godavarianum]TSJ76298.1 DUF1648 domain-containing protein [Corynebacterium godavarianum]